MKKQPQLNTTQVYSLLRARRRSLEPIMEFAGKMLADVPEGTLHTIARNNGSSFQYYRRNPGKELKEEYLKKSEKNMIIGLANKKYNAHILSAAKKEISAIDRFLAEVDRDRLIDSFAELSPGERKFIRPYIYDDDTYAALWEKQEYTGKSFADEKSELYTDKGERVRSKSEILIGNKLANHGIPYKYECPLTLVNGITVYPDFTILNKRTRQIIYWEHLGMMDDPDYVSAVMRKIDSYEASEIWPGKNLIMTHETLNRAVSVKVIERMITLYLC